MTDPLDFPVRQEEDRVSSGSLLHVGVVSLVVGATGVFLAGAILAATTGALQPSAAGPHGPRRATRTLSQVEQTPIWDTRVGLDLRDKQRADLDRWGWVDREAGVARIPIDRAMDIVAREGSR
jgi:hypothetical protein